MLFIKVVTVILAAIAIVKSYLDYKKKQEPRLMFLFWVAVWLVAATVIVYPLLVERAASVTQDNSITIGSLTAVALVFMLYIVYRVYAKASRVEHQLSQLVRKLALKDIQE